MLRPDPVSLVDSHTCAVPESREGRRDSNEAALSDAQKQARKVTGVSLAAVMNLETL